MPNKNFHEGEMRLQNQMGMREKIDVMTEHMMRDFMPDQHREFFEGLEYIFLGTVDENGLPCASILTGPAGFASSPDPKELVIETGPRGDKPAFKALAIGQAVGVLGLDLSNRRRNRMHGQILRFDEETITIEVVQSYGNCPKYISVRQISERGSTTGSDVIENGTLSTEDIAFVTAADTFFIASYVRDGSGAPYEGVDMSHRGGEPGFITVDNPSQISVPDYVGNNLFNTIGNLLINPDMAILLIDFETGDVLNIDGQATLIEDADEIAKYAGAQRLLRIKINNVRRHSGAIALRWKFIESSPFNPALAP